MFQVFQGNSKRFRGCFKSFKDVITLFEESFKIASVKFYDCFITLFKKFYRLEMNPVKVDIADGFELMHEYNATSWG